MKRLPAQGMVMALIHHNVKTEREVILDGIAKLRPEWVEDQYDTGYTDALNDVIDMILAKNKEE